MRRLMVIALLAAAVPLAAHDGVDAQIVALTRQVAREPRNAALYLKRAELHRLHQHWQLAARDYARAATLDPKLHAVDLGHGTMLLDTGRHADAIEPLRRYVRAVGGDPQGRLALGRALLRAGRGGEAVTELAVAVEQASHPDPDLVLEYARALVAANRADDALRHLDAMQERTGALVALLAAIDIEVQRGNFAAALRRVEAAQATATRKESWHVRRADLLLRMGDRAAARAAYEAALAAIAVLPAARRQTRAIAELEARARIALAAN